jgi:hypothetical protein
LYKIPAVYRTILQSITEKVKKLSYKDSIKNPISIDDDFYFTALNFNVYILN